MKNKGIKKSVRDEILVEIALQYRENQKLEQKPQKVRLFEIWQKQKMPYSDFIDEYMATLKMTAPPTSSLMLGISPRNSKA